MKERPAIPADIRRRVLVEAGHCCAIHTCRHPKVDIHHIIPWGQVQEHAYDNLIALCPNCHRRADAGEIDRKSLRLYKARLVASFGISQIGAPKKETADVEMSWRTETVSEKYAGPPSYEVEIEFPKFIHEDDSLREINLLERAYALEKRLKMRWYRLEEFRGDANAITDVLSVMTASYQVSTFDENLISIRYSVFHYGAGAAHPNHWTDVSNYQVYPPTRLSLHALFKTNTNYLQTLSDYCIARLTEEKGQNEPSESVKQGAGPAGENFSRFNITDTGLLVTFDEYKVDAYAAGASQVEVPKEILRDLLNPKCSVAGLWK